MRTRGVRQLLSLPDQKGIIITILWAHFLRFSVDGIFDRHRGKCDIRKSNMSFAEKWLIYTPTKYEFGFSIWNRSVSILLRFSFAYFWSTRFHSCSFDSLIDHKRTRFFFCDETLLRRFSLPWFHSALATICTYFFFTFNFPSNHLSTICSGHCCEKTRIKKKRNSFTIHNLTCS